MVPEGGWMSGGTHVLVVKPAIVCRISKRRRCARLWSPWPALGRPENADATFLEENGWERGMLTV